MAVRNSLRGNAAPRGDGVRMEVTKAAVDGWWRPTYAIATIRKYAVARAQAIATIREYVVACSISGPKLLSEGLYSINLILKVLSATMHRRCTHRTRVGVRRCTDNAVDCDISSSTDTVNEVRREYRREADNGRGQR